MDREEFIISVYCIVEDFLSELSRGKRIRQRGPAPSLSDAEVIAMVVVGEFLGIDGDKGIWAYFRKNYSHFFPTIGDRSAFARQAANLQYWVERLWRKISSYLGAKSHPIHITDGFPIPVTHFKRAYFSSVFKGEAAYGYCASKSENYYGFKGHIVITEYGVISNFDITPANIDERDVLPENSIGLSGIMLGDKGLMRPELSEQLRTQNLKLEHPLRSNMRETRSQQYLHWMSNTRRLVETVIAQLSQRLNVQKVRARKTWNLAGRLVRKILAHTIGVYINKTMGRPLIKLDGVVA